MYKSRNVIYDHGIELDKTIDNLHNACINDGALDSNDALSQLMEITLGKEYYSEEVIKYFAKYGKFVSFDFEKAYDKPYEIVEFMSIPTFYIFNYVLTKRHPIFEELFDISPISANEDTYKEYNSVAIAVTDGAIYTTNDLEYLYDNLTNVEISGNGNYWHYRFFGWDTESSNTDIEELGDFFDEISSITGIDQFICGDPYAYKMPFRQVLVYDSEIDCSIDPDNIPTVFANKDITKVDIEYPDGTAKHLEFTKV